MELFWENSDWELRDRHLSALNLAPFQRKLPEVKLTPGVTLIRGPRQIGKSTWLKLLLKKALSENERCFYYSCEDLRDYTDLQELIISQKNVECFFLDEVTFVKEWWRAIKKDVDSNNKIKFILTGSSSYDLKLGMDSMPGRWSKSGELHLLPMLFDEWLAVRKQAGWPELEKVKAIQGFMKTGGFPAAVAEAGPSMNRPTQSIETYRRWIMGDTLKLDRNEQYMREVFSQIAKTLGSSVSLQGLASKTQLMSYHTVQDYISVLEHAFALRTVYAFNPETDSFQFKKQKKFYFSDPIIYWVALDWAGLSTPSDYEEKLAEMIAAEQLYRTYKRLGYYSSQAGEVDFISGRDIAIEVKWVSSVANVSRAYKDLRVANKKIWSQNTFFD